MAGRSGVAHYNTLQNGAATNSIKAEFARRLQAAMIRKGWNQSELARRASDLLPRPAAGQKRGKTIGRDLISHYVRGMMLPGPANLEAIAKALGLRAEDLMPSGVPHAGGDASPFKLEQAGEGRMFIRLNRTISPNAANKIMAILLEEDHP